MVPGEVLWEPGAEGALCLGGYIDKCVVAPEAGVKDVRDRGFISWKRRRVTAGEFCRINAFACPAADNLLNVGSRVSCSTEPVGRENPARQEGPGRIKQVNPLAVTTSLCGDYTKLLLWDAQRLGRSQGCQEGPLPSPEGLDPGVGISTCPKPPSLARTNCCTC